MADRREIAVRSQAIRKSPGVAQISHPGKDRLHTGETSLGDHVNHVVKPVCMRAAILLHEPRVDFAAELNTR